MHDESEIIAAAWHRLRWVEQQQQQQHQQRAARADGRLLAGHREKKSPLPKGPLVLSHHWPRSRATGARSSTGGSSRDSISRGGSICTRLPSSRRGQGTWQVAAAAWEVDMRGREGKAVREADARHYAQGGVQTAWASKSPEAQSQRLRCY